MRALRYPPWAPYAACAAFAMLLLWFRLHLSYKASHSGSEIVMVTASNHGKAIGDEAEYKLNVFLNRASYAYRHGYEFVWADITAFPVPHTDDVQWAKVRIVSAAFAAFPKAKWVWWLDLDAIIMTPSLPLSSFLSPDGMRSVMLPPDTKIRGTAGISELNVSYPLRSSSRWDKTTRFDEDGVHMLLTQDEWAGINDGSFFLKRGNWADWVLDLWIDQHFVERGWGLREQDAILNLMLQHKMVRNGVGVVHQRAINAYFNEGIMGHEPTGHQSGNGSVVDRHSALNWLGANWLPGDLLVHFAGCGTGGWCENAWRKSWARREREREEDIQGALAKRERGEWGIEVGLEDVDNCKCSNP